MNPECQDKTASTADSVIAGQFPNLVAGIDEEYADLLSSASGASLHSTEYPYWWNDIVRFGGPPALSPSALGSSARKTPAPRVGYLLDTNIVMLLQDFSTTSKTWQRSVALAPAFESLSAATAGVTLLKILKNWKSGERTAALASALEPLSATTVGTTLVAAAEIAWRSYLDTSRKQILANYKQYIVRNWDGYGAEPITLETIDATRTFLNIIPNTFGKPRIAPGGDGIVALEWVLHDGPLRKLFVDIGPGTIWSAYYRRSNGDKNTLPSQEIDRGTKEILENLFRDLSR